jgi:hypothetical protein
VTELRQSILDQITKAVDDIMADATESTSQSRRNEIRDEVLAYAQRVLEACSKGELQSERAFEQFIETMVATVRRRLHIS